MNSVINRYAYTVEKLTAALSVLVTHPGDARARLGSAFHCFLTLREKDFPPELQGRWRWILDELTKFGPLLDQNGVAWRGSVENTMRRIKNRTASKIIEEIYALYWEVSENEQYL